MLRMEEMETTLVLLKPDAIQKRLAGTILQRFEAAGLRIRACKLMVLSEEILREHYQHLVSFPFFPEVLGFMQSSPVLALALEGPNAIAQVRDLVGPTDSQKAPKGTIRGDMGEDKMRNLVHASDTPENALQEIGRFFSKNEVVA